MCDSLSRRALLAAAIATERWLLRAVTPNRCRGAAKFGTGGRAVAGVKGTMLALTRGQVDELLLSASLEQLYPEEETLEEPQAMAAGAGSESGARTVLLPDELVTKAAQTGASVTFIENPDLLASVGGVGAFLRYRI